MIYMRWYLRLAFVELVLELNLRIATRRRDSDAVSNVQACMELIDKGVRAINWMWILKDK